MSAYAYGHTIARAGAHAPRAGSRGGRHTRDGWSSINAGRVAIGARISDHSTHCGVERRAGGSCRLRDSTRIAVFGDRCRQSLSIWIAKRYQLLILVSLSLVVDNRSQLRRLQKATHRCRRSGRTSCPTRLPSWRSVVRTWARSCCRPRGSSRCSRARTRWQSCCWPRRGPRPARRSWKALARCSMPPCCWAKSTRRLLSRSLLRAEKPRARENFTSNKDCLDWQSFSFNWFTQLLFLSIGKPPRKVRIFSIFI